MEKDPFCGVRDFIEANNLKPVGGPLIVAEAIVEYKYGGRSVTGFGKIHISIDTFGYGEIDIVAPKFDVNDVHTNFRPRCQNMEFDRFSGKLIINGNSPKMAGDYSISILII